MNSKKVATASPFNSYQRCMEELQYRFDGESLKIAVIFHQFGFEAINFYDEIVPSMDSKLDIGPYMEFFNNPPSSEDNESLLRIRITALNASRQRCLRGLLEDFYKTSDTPLNKRLAVTSTGSSNGEYAISCKAFWPENRVRGLPEDPLRFFINELTEFSKFMKKIPK